MLTHTSDWWLTAHDPRAAEALAAAEARQHSSRGAAVALPALRSAPASRALPPGRIDWSGTATHRPAFSVASAAAFAVLRAEGRVGPDLFEAEDGEENFRPAYDWMRWQMLRRVPGYTGRFPMWMWLRIRRGDLLSLARTVQKVSPGAVLLRLEVPRDRVLASGHGAWHDVLNGCPRAPSDCPRCDRDPCEVDEHLDSWFDAWFDAWDACVPRSPSGERLPWWHWPVELRGELMQTWDSVLRPAPTRAAIQGTAEYIESAWVTDAVVLG